jgi:hypothetical protein
MTLLTPAGTNYIPVRDLAAAASWYVEKFEVKQRPAKFDDGQRGVELWKADEIWFVLGPANVPNSGETPMLNARNIQKARDYLIARGIEAGDIQTDAQGTRFFEMRDLEGNVIEVLVEP